VESPLCEGGRAPGLRLIETLLWDGAEFRHQDRHLQRMVRSAAALGWSVDDGAVRAALVTACADAQGPLRVRLTQDRDGVLAVETAPPPPAKQVWQVGLAGDRLHSADPWLTVKTTRRPAYDAARAAMPAGLDEVVFLNERDEVCDGTIMTLFFDRGQGLRTPPLTCGLLPGVLRASLLDGGAVQEDILLARDLPHVRLWVGNSLRGLVPAVWAGG
jgi:4-amino-4-deoxychorismate lyase